MRQNNSNIVAIIPARGGSKRIAHKNLATVAGRPLIAHTILRAKQAERVQEVYVSTEDEKIAEISQLYGAKVVWRPLDISTDEATSESALLHVLDNRIQNGLHDPDLVVFLQCTSPIRRPYDIDRAVDTLVLEKADSLFSACENNRLIWKVEDGKPYSINYNYHKRQREQDMKMQYRENGSIYVFRPEILRRQRNRLGGKIAIYEMDYWSSFQIDTPEHIELVEWILTCSSFKTNMEWPHQIELAVFDFDGVMTDNSVIVTEKGEEAVLCDRGDGWGVAKLLEAGIPMLVLSTETNPVVAARCAKLNLPFQQGLGDKRTFLADYLKKHGIHSTNVIYVGNDLNDLECFNLVGWPVAVADAHPSLIAASKWVLSHQGGKGAIRELCDKLLVHIGCRKEFV